MIELVPVEYAPKITLGIPANCVPFFTTAARESLETAQSMTTDHLHSGRPDRWKNDIQHQRWWSQIRRFEAGALELSMELQLLEEPADDSCESRVTASSEAFASALQDFIWKTKKLFDEVFDNEPQVQLGAYADVARYGEFLAWAGSALEASEAEFGPIRRREQAWARDAESGDDHA